MTRIRRDGSPYRPRASREEMRARYTALAKIVEDQQPTGGRFVYYRAVGTGVAGITKDDSGAEIVQRALVKMRKLGIIPYEWITDDTRTSWRPNSYGDVQEALIDVAQRYRKALWRESAFRVEVWCESNSIAGVLHPVTDEWDLPLFPIRGQTSDSFAYAAGTAMEDDDRAIVVLYFGDHDPAGLEIESQLRAKLVEHSGRTDIIWRRVGVTPGQIIHHSLVGGRPKKSTWRDAHRQRHPFDDQAVEVEALDPPILRALLTGLIKKLMPQEDRESLRQAETIEREILEGLAESLLDYEA